MQRLSQRWWSWCLELLSRGSDEGSAYAAGALTILVFRNNAVAAAVVAAGAIPLLVELLSSGSDDGRVYAAVALGNLACGNDTITAAVVAAARSP